MSGIQVVPLAWVNMMVYDYEGRLQTGRQELYAWPCGSELEEEVNFMGSNVLNLSTSEDVSVEIEVIEPCVGVAGKPITYPTEAQINKFALEMSQVSIPAVSQQLAGSHGLNNSHLYRASSRMI